MPCSDYRLFERTDIDMVSVQQGLVLDQLVTHRSCLISVPIVDQPLLGVLVLSLLQNDPFAIWCGYDDIGNPEPGISKQVL